eukprot:442566-Rhodomonas_salina.3
MAPAKCPPSRPSATQTSRSPPFPFFSFLALLFLFFSFLCFLFSHTFLPRVPEPDAFAAGRVDARQELRTRPPSLRLLGCVRDVPVGAARCAASSVLA